MKRSDGFRYIVGLFLMYSRNSYHIKVYIGDQIVSHEPSYQFVARLRLCEQADFKLINHRLIVFKLVVVGVYKCNKHNFKSIYL